MSTNLEAPVFLLRSDKPALVSATAGFALVIPYMVQI